jgi:hypothetical protein
MIRLYMFALNFQPVENKETFINLSKMQTLEVELRASAAQTVAIADLKAANNIMATQSGFGTKEKGHQPNG